MGKDIMWKPVKANGEHILKWEAFDASTSVEIVSPGYPANYEILCDCYNLTLHTVFADTLEEANGKYEQIKKELQEIAIIKDEEKREDMICDFVDRW